MSTLKEPAVVVVGNSSSSSTDEDVAVPISTNVIEPITAKRPLWRRLVGFFWDSVDGDPRDRRYIQKLDTFLL